MIKSDEKVYKDVFALHDKKGSGKVSAESLGNSLRAVGQNPTLAEIQDLQETGLGGEKEFDYPTFVKIINRPDGFKQLGEVNDYTRAFQVFDKNLTGFIGVGELKYILTSIGEKLSESEVDELLKGVSVTDDQKVDYSEFVKSILEQ